MLSIKSLQWPPTALVETLINLAPLCVNNIRFFCLLVLCSLAIVSVPMQSRSSRTGKMKVYLPAVWVAVLHFIWAWLQGLVTRWKLCCISIFQKCFPVHPRTTLDTRRNSYMSNRPTIFFRSAVLSVPVFFDCGGTGKINVNYFSNHLPDK